MSDLGRKGLGEQASEKLQPDSTKSTGQKAGENASGIGDKISSAIQPEGNKSATQKVGDSARSGGDSAQKQGGGVVESAQKGLSDAGESISNALGGGQKK